jgi:hypothetical protein
MASVDPEVYQLMLERTVWSNPAQVHYIQSVAADDPTLVNLYDKFVESKAPSKDENNS